MCRRVCATRARRMSTDVSSAACSLLKAGNPILPSLSGGCARGPPACPIFAARLAPCQQGAVLFVRLASVAVFFARTQASTQASKQASQQAKKASKEGRKGVSIVLQMASPPPPPKPRFPNTPFFLAVQSVLRTSKPMHLVETHRVSIAVLLVSRAKHASKPRKLAETHRKTKKRTKKHITQWGGGGGLRPRPNPPPLYLSRLYLSRAKRA